jgi:hypothetical protein
MCPGVETSGGERPFYIPAKSHVQILSGGALAPCHHPRMVGGLEGERPEPGMGLQLLGGSNQLSALRHLWSD